MRIKLDENLPSRLVSLLTQLGHDVDTVPAEGIAGKDDDIVWRAAQTGRRFLVTQDLDFSDLRESTHRARITGFCWSDFRNQGGARSSRELRRSFKSRISRAGPVAW